MKESTPIWREGGGCLVALVIGAAFFVVVHRLTDDAWTAIAAGVCMAGLAALFAGD